MRTIGGLTKSTPPKWLPVLSNIDLPKIQRKHALIIKNNRELSKFNNLNLPIYTDLVTLGYI